MRKRATHVYFLATVDRSIIKIGHSYFPSHRLSAIQGWSPIKLELLVTVLGTMNDERAMHGRHMASHAHHEWFYASPQLLADIAEIQRLGHLPDHLTGRENEPPHIKTDQSYRRTPEWRAQRSLLQKKAWADRRERERSPQQSNAAVG